MVLPTFRDDLADFDPVASDLDFSLALGGAAAGAGLEPGKEASRLVCQR